MKKIALNNLKSLANDKTKVELEGTVDRLCKKKGCWMILKSGQEQVRVTFKGYSFFVPNSLKGQKVKAQGVVKELVQSVAHQKHLLEDEGVSQKVIDKVKNEKKVLEFVASSVQKI